jgi:transketolase
MFVAEQQMIAAAIGFGVRGLKPFASAFAAFFSRAYDFIRMAAISRASLRIVGSHAGVAPARTAPRRWRSKTSRCSAPSTAAPSSTQRREPDREARRARREQPRYHLPAHHPRRHTRHLPAETSFSIGGSRLSAPRPTTTSPSPPPESPCTRH